MFQRFFPQSLGTAAFLVALPAFMLAVGSTGACGSGDPQAEPVGPTGTGSGGGPGGQGGAGGFGDGVTGREVFEEFVQEQIMDECGACHQLQGSADAPFLAAPDIYVSISSWPGFLLADWPTSTLLNYPSDPQHGGGEAPDLSAELRSVVEDWLAKESNDLPEPDEKFLALTPFRPLVQGAFNTVYLDELGPQFTNVSITFNAEELGEPPSILILENIQVHPISDLTLFMTHPLFVTYPADGSIQPDPSDSFSTFEQEFSLDTPSQLGTGTLVLTGWEKDAFLGLAFENLEATGGSVGFIPCSDLGAFQANAVPALQVCANTCHGGDDEQAMATMDLSGLNAPTPEEACGQVRARITAKDPGKSQIVIVTDPGEPVVHKFKFKGVPADHAAFKAAVSPWINAE